MRPCSPFAASLLSLALTVSVGGCKDDSTSKPGAGQTPAAPAPATPAAAPAGAAAAGSGPTRDEAVRVLREVASALEAKDYEKAMPFFMFKAGTPDDQVKKQLAKLIEIKEISTAGVDRIAAAGKWGKMDEVFAADTAKRLAERNQVPLDQCYAIKLDAGEAGLYWNGTQFKIFRCDDIGKLAP